MNFNYEHNPTTVSVFGEEYEIPTKTAWFVDEVNKACKDIVAAETSVQGAGATIRCIALYLGEEFTEKHYPDADRADTDELGALLAFLKSASAAATAKVLEKYAPAKLSR